MNYKNLLNPIIKVQPITLLGQPVFIRRLTQQELFDYDAKLNALDSGPGYLRASSLCGVNLFLSALVDEGGNRPKKSDLPDADEFLKIHSHADLVEAVVTVQRHSYGSLDDAKKN